MNGIEIGYIDEDVIEHIHDDSQHVTSTEKTNWNAKQGAITGAATSIVSNNFTNSGKILMSSSDKKVAETSYDATTLASLVGISQSATVESRLTTLATDLDTAESDIDALETSTTSLGTRLTTAEGDIDALETRVTTAESDIDTLETGATAMGTRMTAAEGNITAMQTSISLLPQKTGLNASTVAYTNSEGKLTSTSPLTASRLLKTDSSGSIVAMDALTANKNVITDANGLLTTQDISGTIVNVSSSTAVNVNGDSGVIVNPSNPLTLSAGKWIVFASAAFSHGTSGYASSETFNTSALVSGNSGVGVIPLSQWINRGFCLVDSTSGEWNDYTDTRRLSLITMKFNSTMSYVYEVATTKNIYMKGYVRMAAGGAPASDYQSILGYSLTALKVV